MVCIQECSASTPNSKYGGLGSFEGEFAVYRRLSKSSLAHYDAFYVRRDTCEIDNFADVFVS
jgi:hypothetical protein